MSKLILVGQSAVIDTPSLGQMGLFGWSTNDKLAFKDDNGNVYTFGLSNASIANQTGFATDSYLTGSNITVNAGQWRARTCYHLIFDMVKTAAGTAAAALNIRLGTLGTTGDTARLTFTFGAGTAAIDSGIFEVFCLFRTVGSGTSAVIEGHAKCDHHLAATGLISTGAAGTGIIFVTSSGFDSTTPTIIGASFNGGASFSGTNRLVRSELFDI